MRVYTSFLLRGVLLVALAITAPRVATADGTLIPLTTRRDMVFDHSGRYLYITTSDGWVRPYNLATGQLEGGYNLGGSLLGADIAADDSFLLVSQSTATGPDGTLHKLHLPTGTRIDITYSRRSLESGSFDVAIAANGRAFFTTLIDGSGVQPLREVNLATNAVSVRNDVPGSGNHTSGVSAPTQIHRSADRSRLYFLEMNISSGPVFTYSATTNSFGRNARTGDYFSYATAAVSRDGSLVSTLLGMDAYPALHVPSAAIDTAPDFRFVRSLASVNRGMAFSPVADLFFGVSSTAGQIIAYDTQTFAELFRIPLGDSIETNWNAPLVFGTGTLVASPDGRYLALATVSGVRLYTLPVSTPTPLPTPVPTLAKRRDMVFDHSGQFLYVSTSDGKIVRQTLATGALEVIADVGSPLNGIDILRDDSAVLVAGDKGGVAEATFYRVNLATRAVTNINFARHDSESGGWDIAIGSNGLAMATTRVPPGSTAPTVLRQVNLDNYVVSVRDDVPFPNFGNPAQGPREIGQETQVHRSADGTRFYFLAANSSLGPIFTYSASTNTFGRYAHTNTFLHWASAAVSRDGALLATRHGYPNRASIDSAPDLHLTGLLRFDGGCAFDARSDVLYGVDTVTDEIVAYDLTSSAERYRFPVGADAITPSYMFDTGQLVASNDGRYLAFAIPSGVRTIAIPESPPALRPPENIFADVHGLVFDHSGHYLYIATHKGLIWPYSLATGRLEAPYDVGGSVYGLDIAPDDSYLLLAQNAVGLAEGRVQKLALPSGAITNMPFAKGSAEGGAWDIALAANGLAFVTGRHSSPPLRQVNMATQSVSLRDPGGNRYLSHTRIFRSADRQRLLFRTEALSGSPAFIYEAAADTFGPSFNTSPWAAPGVAISRDGSLAVQSERGASLFSLPSWSPVHTFAGISQAVVFSQTADVLYGVNAETDQIIGYNIHSFSEEMRIPVGENVSDYLTSFWNGQFVSSPNGRYLAFVTNTALRIYDLATGSTKVIPTASYLANISTRTRVGTGDDVAIAGFIIRGSEEKKVVLRGVGPSLGAFGVNGTLQDPVLELRDGAGQLVATSDSWRESQQALEEVRLAPTDDREAAMVRTLPPGAYTVILRGQSNTTGVGLVEVFGIDPNADATPVNISTRGFVGTGDNVMIAGVIVGKRGSNSYGDNTKKLVIRGIGPSLQNAGVAGALANPHIQLFDAQGTTLGSNDDWRSGFAVQQLIAVGLAPSHEREAAMFRTLGPGAYTAILRGSGGSTGVGLIEVYSVE